MEKRKKIDVPVQSVSKALELLDILIFESLDNQGQTLSKLAHQMGLAVNSVHNLLKTMSVCGYVCQDGSGKYMKGAKIGMISKLNHILSAHVIQQIQKEMAGIVEEISESIVLTILIKGQRWVVARIENNQTISISHPESTSKNFYILPTGRALAAWANESQLNEIIEANSYPNELWDNVSDKISLKKKLADIRKVGHVTSREPCEGTHLISMSVPVLDNNGALIGALGSYAPEFRCDLDKEHNIKEKLRELSTVLSPIMQG